MNKYFAIFGGGGVRGISYCGAYKALLENNIIITGCAGSSIGSVFATLLNIGYDYNEIYELLSNTGFEMFIDLQMNFKKDVALSKGNIFYEWIKEKIEKKFYKDLYKKGEMKKVTFYDLKCDLIIYSVDITNMKFKEFSKYETPDFEVAKAVRASVSMPGLFSPLELNGNLIVDGDLIKSTPLWRMSNNIKNKPEKILEFRLEDNEDKKEINNISEYINRIYNTISGFATDYIIDLYKEKDKFDYIKINTKDVSVVDFLIPKEKKKELFDIGYKRTADYLKNYLPQKKKILKEKYAKIANHLIKLEKNINKNDYISAYLTLCEMFILLCDEKKYIDFAIYQKILTFKDNFTNNYTQSKILLFNKAKLTNKNILTEEILNLIKEITQKIEE